MVKIMKKTGSIILLLICCILLMAGCSRKLTPKRLMSQITDNLAKARSVSNTLKMQIELEDVLDTTKINMEMQMENTVKPKAGHAKGTAEVDLSGTKVGSNIEIYQVEEGRQFVTYSSMYDKWSREVSEGSGKGSFSGNLFQEAGDSIKTFHLAEQTVKVNKKECYEMYGNITGKELIQFMGLDMLGAFGMVKIPDTNAIARLQIPVTIDVYKDGILPARIIVDMTDVMNDLYDKYKKTTNVNDYTIQLGYTGFNKVDKIQVPQEVKDACK